MYLSVNWCFCYEANFVTKACFAFSPSSGACSTDSAGSSLSIDEGDGCWSDGYMGDAVAPARYGTGPCHGLLTPEEPIILEENSEDYTPWNGPIPTGRPMST